jgi:hypothetical protein
VRRLLAIALAWGLALPAAAHEERPSEFPTPPGRVPTYRTSGPSLVVCGGAGMLERIRELPPRMEARNLALLERCRFRSIQAAVNHVTEQGSRILILPGVYRERRFGREPTGDCAELTDQGPLSYAQHRQCPHVQNLIAILGDSSDPDRECDLAVCRLQIEGTGARPEDVIVDNNFRKLNAIRADRADGVYFRNFTVQRSEFNSLYVIETDGFVIDRMLARWNDEYGFLTFSSDHGLYTHCEAYGNGDGGLYPGSAADLHGTRPSIEITRCNSHHNLLGYSGTAGNSTYVHHNRFHHNTAGVTMDSLFPDHPGLPQDAATFRHNRIHSNNQDYYRYIDDGTCDRPFRKRGYEEGVVCPKFGVPIGTGILVAGGNDNLFARNRIWNNWRYGGIQFWVPATLRGEEDPEKQYDTSHFNRWRRNVMGRAPGGAPRPNGLDFWWDAEGEGNCWQANRSPGGVTSDPLILPTCRTPSVMNPVSQNFRFASCATWSEENNHPPGCDWMDPPPRPS